MMLREISPHHRARYPGTNIASCRDWEEHIITKIAATFGKVLKIYEVTSARIKGRFARVCVEVDLTKPLKPGVRIGTPMDSFFQTIAYGNLPSLCFSGWSLPR